MTPAPPSASDESTLRAVGRVLLFGTTAGLSVALLMAPVRVSGQMAGTMVRVSVGPGGVEANGASAAPVVSDDGRYVAFDSDASNLVTGDTNGSRDVFLADLETQTLERVSISSVGVQGNGHSYSPAMSSDATRIVYVSEASTLVSGDTNQSLDVFLFDRVSRQTTRLHTHSGPLRPSEITFYRRFLQWQVAISRDGKLVAYAADGNLYLYDLDLGQSEIVTDDPGHVDPLPARMPSISSDGRRVYFDRPGPLGSGLGRGVVSYDRVTRTFAAGATFGVHDMTHARPDGTSFVATAAGGFGGIADVYPQTRESWPRTLSTERGFLLSAIPTGRHAAVAISTPVAGGGRRSQVGFSDHQLSTFQRVSTTPSGEWGNGPSTMPAISADGAVVAFSSRASDLVPGDANGITDVFARRMGPCVTSVTPPGPFDMPAAEGQIAVTIAVTPTCASHTAGPRTIGVPSNPPNALARTLVFSFGEMSVTVNQAAGGSTPPCAITRSGVEVTVPASGGAFDDPGPTHVSTGCILTFAVAGGAGLAFERTAPYIIGSGYSFTVARNQSLAPRTFIVSANSIPWVTIHQPTVQQHFAEGATGPFFDTRFALFQGAGPDVPVRLTFSKNTGEVITRELMLPGARPITVRPREIPGLETAEFSTTVATEAPIAVDRTMTWDASGYGAHAEIGLPEAAPRWYLAEGTTRPGFSLFYLLQNPDPTSAAQVRVSFLLPAGPPVVRHYLLPPSSRTTVWVNQVAEVAGSDVSASFEVVAGPPIAVERTQYYSRGATMFAAGHGSAAVAAPQASWLFAEGATGPYFDTFLLLANPTGIAADVEVSYYLTTGGPLKKRYTLPPQSRYTIWIDQERIPGSETALANTGVAIRVQAFNVPVVAERAMWWPGSADTWNGAHNSGATTTPGVIWMSAEGEVGGPSQAETYLLVSNPFRVDSWPGQPTPTETPLVHVRVFGEDGTSALRSYAVDWESRITVPIRKDFPAIEGKRFGITLHSGFDGRNAFSIPVVVERSMYWDANGEHWAAGTNAPGTRVQ